MAPGRISALAAAILAASGAAGWAADAANGEKEFRKCKSCHSIVADDGTEIVKGGKTGPNLFGVIGRTVGSVEGFRYGDSLEAVGEAGTVWDEANLATYVQDPNAWLKEALGDPKAKSKMTFKLTKGADDVAAYLATLGAPG